jgi:ankyrin repeat protein
VAITRGHVDAAKALIDAGADVNHVARGGFTPLHTAAMAGLEGVARLLIGKGARVNARAGSGMIGLTPLALAEHAGKRGMAKLLRERGA